MSEPEVSPSPSPVPPLRIAGRYIVRRELGRGMMGVVYEAEDSVLGRNVAVKTIEIAFDVSAAAREEFELRFFTEARVAAKLAHPGIVVCHDVGKDPESGKLFIVFEHLKGRTLAERVAGSRLGWREGIAIVAKVARAIQHAHEHGVIHRDLKPANVMLLEIGAGTRPTASIDDPAIKIMDFGVAKMESARVHLTAAGQSFGSPLYMSPEQALGHYSDARSDIFSVGSILCTVLLGRPWFQAPNIPKILGRVVHDDAPVISELVHGLPTSLDRVVARALAKHVEARYAAAADLADDLEDILSGREPRHASGWTVSPLPIEGKHEDDPLLAELTTRVAAATVVDVDPVEIDPASVRTGTVNVLASLVEEPATAATAEKPAAPAKTVRRSWAGPLGALLVITVLAAVPTFLALRHLPTAGHAAVATAVPETAAVRTAAPATPEATEVPTEVPTEAPPTAAPTAPTAAPKAPVAAVATPAPAASATATHEPAQAQVLVRVTHPLENGRLVVWIDGVLVFETKLKAEVAKKIVAIKLREGRVEKTLSLEPGRHEFKVEMTWDDKRKVETTVAEVNTETTGVLDVNLARVTNDLSLAWSVAAKAASP